jgi:hypothetical protein
MNASTRQTDLHETDDSGFGGGVGAHACVSFLPGDRRDQKDPTVVVLEHVSMHPCMAWAATGVTRNRAG